ncbi:Uncharacterised protein [Salmonella enterica subsp. enterica serovar Typhimurium str. DT104]|nr:Uncharacterised protein [Salmonella enterica subsp. enterica serovar Typhimurium str. DT104]
MPQLMQLLKKKHEELQLIPPILNIALTNGTMPMLIAQVMPII